MGLFGGKPNVELLRAHHDVKGLIRALRDRDPSIRERAAEILGIIADVRAVDPLIAALRDKDELVRLKAVNALGDIGHPRSKEPLMAAMADTDPSVRDKAADALRKLTGRAGV